MNENYITIENEYYKIFIPKLYEEYGKKVMEYSTQKLKEYLSFFKEKSFGCKIKGAFLMTREDYVKRVQLHEPDYIPPEWAKGGYYGDEAIILLTSETLNQRFNTLSHESFHLLFKKFVYKKNSMDRIIWLDESLANNFDGRIEYQIKNGNFENKVLELNEKQNLPKMKDLVFDKKTQEKNGCNIYDLFKIVGRYLVETMNDDELFDFINDENKIKEAGETILEDSISYFVGKYSKTKKAA